jgi:hypothetical protein
MVPFQTPDTGGAVADIKREFKFWVCYVARKTLRFETF